MPVTENVATGKEIVGALTGKKIVGIRVSEDIVSEVIFNDGTKMVGAMVVVKP